MIYRKIAIFALAILLPLSMSAQKKKKRVVKKPPVVVVEEPQEDPRITNMREMTQQIVIIDSIVTDKDDVLQNIRLSAETGRLMTTADFLRKKISGNAFLNEMGNKVYFSLPDDSLRLQLYTSDKLGNEWSTAQPLQGISEGISEASYPFMLNDGITFYFAAKGEESIGGYDIFLTRYDSRNRRFLKPENIGMPFNSEANDYLYAVDEQNKIGYFVSDRRQPEGKVCIYIFVPSETRKTYDLSVYSDEKLRSLASIERIADTWGNGQERKAALARLKAIGTQKSGRAILQSSFVNNQLIINDAFTYSSASDFRSAEAAALYKQLLNLRTQKAELDKELSQARDYYAKANSADRQTLRKEILQAEEETAQLDRRIKTLEKEIRNKENLFIK